MLRSPQLQDQGEGDTSTKVKVTQRYDKCHVEPTAVLRNTKLNVLLLSDDSNVSFVNFVSEYQFALIACQNRKQF